MSAFLSRWEEVDRDYGLVGKDLQWYLPGHPAYEQRWPTYRGPIKRAWKRDDLFYCFQFEWVARIYEYSDPRRSHELDDWRLDTSATHDRFVLTLLDDGYIVEPLDGRIFAKPCSFGYCYLFLTRNLPPEKVKGLTLR